MKQSDLVEALKKGIIGWIDFPKNCRIGYAQLENGRLYLPEDSYDVIISIADIEKVENPQLFVNDCLAKLNSRGRLFLAANNRFALRFFCGDRDPYTERNFDGIEGYCRAYSKQEDRFEGRCYSESELRKILENVGIKKYKFYSVLTDLNNPTLLYSEEYLPPEDLSCRIFPTYNFPSTVFMDEKVLMQGIIENGMFHKMAEAYLIECTLEGDLSDALQVTNSIERGAEDALYTILHKSGVVEKKAVYSEGIARLEKLILHNKLLKENGISVIDGEMIDTSYIMPFIDAEIGQVYLKKLLKKNVDIFLAAMDHFRDLILMSSPIEEIDKGDGWGAILKYGYIDMVPLNSFFINDTFYFFDQEFCENHYPANAIIWRMVATFYSGDIEAQGIYPMDKLIERYNLKKYQDKWQKMELDFLRKLRNEDILSDYHRKVRADSNIINSNRQRMNFSVEDYQRIFVDIFDHAEHRKIYVFGSGNFAKKFIALYKKDYKIYAIVDNQKEKWGQEIDGIKIFSPDILQNVQSGEYKVIVCIKNYLSVIKQLEEMGIHDYSIYDWNKSYNRKLRPLSMNGNLEECKKTKKYHIGYVAGAFDMFHKGHLNLLKNAKEQCDYLIVGVISDANIERLKNKKSIIPQEDRLDIVSACRYVDQAEVLPEGFEGIQDAFRMYHFDVLFSGNDHIEDDAWIADREFLRKNGADIVFFPYTKKVSSTKLREIIKEQVYDETT